MLSAKILIDAITMSNCQPGGYRTYTTNLVQYLRQIDAHNQYIIAVDRMIGWTPQQGWELNVIERRGSLGLVVREQLTLPRCAKKNRVDLIHAPAATAPLSGDVPLLVTIHDTIEFSDPLPTFRQTKRWGMRIYSRYAQRRAANVAAHIVTMSNYSKQQISTLFNVPTDRISVIHLAPAPIYCSQERKSAVEVVRRRWAVYDYVFGIASAAKRKNVIGILKSYCLLDDAVRRRHPLVLVCTHPGVKAHVAELAQRAGMVDRALLLENVSDTELASLYAAASVFVFPSFKEGFGLPPVEAMACGVPVITSNVSSLPEVVGDAGILVDPSNVHEIADALNCVLTKPSCAAELRDRGLEHSRSFSWLKVARQTMTVYEQLTDAQAGSGQ